MTTLNYDNAAALINAFKQGAKFKVTNPSGHSRPVTDISAGGAHGIVVKTGLASGGWCYFRPNGANSISPARLIRDESLGFERTTVTVGDSVFGWTGKRGEGAKSAAPAPTVEKPLLQRMLDGVAFHCPKTREIVQEITFQSGALAVKFKAEGAKTPFTRTSMNYRHDGTHKHDPARNLVAGPVPPKAPVVPEYTAEDFKAGVAVEGVYKPTDGTDVRVVVLGPYKDERVAIYVGFIFPTPRLDNRRYVKTDEKPSAVLARINR